jgi:hypothetical protein
MTQITFSVASHCCRNPVDLFGRDVVRSLTASILAVVGWLTHGCCRNRGVCCWGHCRSGWVVWYCLSGVAPGCQQRSPELVGPVLSLAGRDLNCLVVAAAIGWLLSGRTVLHHDLMLSSRRLGGCCRPELFLNTIRSVWLSVEPVLGLLRGTAGGNPGSLDFP